MEQLITFLKSTWGYLLIGGFSVGALITMFVILFKSIKTFKTNEKTFLETVKDTIKHKEDSDVVQATSVAQSEYFSEVQSVLFKLISYIVMASKMAQDDKIVLLNAISTIGKDKYTELFKKAYSELKDDLNNIEFPEAEIPPVVKEVADVVESAKSLLDKYTS